MTKHILLLGLLISNAALADCDRSDKAMGKGTDKCQLCYKDPSGKQTYGNPWQVVPKITEKQKLAVALNSVLCKQPDNSAKSFLLPNEDSAITNENLFKAIHAMYVRSPNSGMKAYPDSQHSDGCDNAGEPTIGGLSHWPIASHSDPIGYLTRSLNACMVKLGTPYAKNYCFTFTTTSLPSNDEYSKLRKGVVGLMIKNGVISNATGYLF